MKGSKKLFRPGQDRNKEIRRSGQPRKSDVLGVVPGGMGSEQFDQRITIEEQGG